MPGFGERTFGNESVPMDSNRGVRNAVSADAVPLRGLFGDTQPGNADAVRPSWVQHGTRTDHGLCRKCARSGGKGRKKAGSDLCTPHIIQERRLAAKMERNVPVSGE